MKVKSENAKYILDNAPIHVSKQTKKIEEELEIDILILQPNSSSLAPTQWVLRISKKNPNKLKLSIELEFNKSIEMEHF